MGSTRISDLSLDVVVFNCGALVMAFEIIGSRVLTPYIGASIYVWTGLIGVILASLSLGYWWGGRMADKRPDVRVLATVIFFAGGSISAMVLVKDIVLSFLSDAPIPVELRSVTAALLLFSPASVCLGVVTPYAIRLRIRSVSDSGKTVGRLYALSTVGSIVGTFGAGFYLLPFVGTNWTLYLIAAALIGTSLLLSPFAISATRIGVLVLFAISIVANELAMRWTSTTNGLVEIDTRYSHVRVFTTTEPVSGRPIRAIATDPYFVQSAMFLESDDLAFEYSRYYHLARYYKPGFKTVLMLGGAGYSVPKEFLRKYSDISLDVVEIDPGMTEIAKRYFRLPDDPRLHIFHEDGRTFVTMAESGRYDVIMMDALDPFFSVPYQLTTIEAVRQMKRALKDEGVVIFNLGSAIHGPASRFLIAELSTYRAVFESVSVFKVNQSYPDDQLQNLMIVAAKHPPELGAEHVDLDSADLLGHIYKGEIPPTEALITDDLAPVEYYNAIALDNYIAGRK